MQVSLKHPPKTTIQNHPNYRVVHLSLRQGNVGMLLPHANLVVPDKEAIRDLKEIIQLYEKVQPEPFNYGTASGYREKLLETEQVEPLPQLDDPLIDLPLFEKLL